MENKSQSITQSRDKFLELIDKNKNKTFWIIAHDNPDPDAIASAFAMKCLLKFLGVSSEIFYFGEIDFRNLAESNAPIRQEIKNQLHGLSIKSGFVS